MDFPQHSISNILVYFSSKQFLRYALTIANYFKLNHAEKCKIDDDDDIFGIMEILEATIQALRQSQ